MYPYYLDKNLEIQNNNENTKVNLAKSQNNFSKVRNLLSFKK